MEEENKLRPFEDRKIRHVWHNEEWYISVLDVIEVLADTPNPSDYFKKMRRRDEALKSYVGTNCPQIALEGKSGKKRKTIVGNTEHIFRIIQSIPSPKAEPFKQWLAKVGYERLQEIENPELAAQRMRESYRLKGYSDEWIDKRMQSINIRTQLTDEWQARDVEKGIEYSILTAEIFRAAFGIAPSEHKEKKDLKKRDNLRDHMTDLELIFTMLAETTTKHKAIEKNAQGFEQNKRAAIEAGAATGKAIDTYEKETGANVVSSDNFKDQIAAAKEQKKLERKNKNVKK